ncbi:S1 family peptidase [Streptomyces sp. 549]|uniref:S1 family peptidase n=1 Tax=Streptomyces sp. 549 TaxID=3049076 RepID=UPI0024C3E355|nr:S1 family peptidase [Streptomyces sp. 549]MDK1474081.1 S1 family peptidase [Streptomyces sp. 549]
MTFSTPARPHGRRRPLTVVALTAALALLPVTAGTAWAGEAAEPAPGQSATADGLRTAAGLEKALGERTTGAYLHPRTGELTVNVTDAAAERQVRAAGAAPRRVSRDAAELDAAVDTLESKASIPGTSWGVDPVTNRVEVHADESVSAHELAQLDRVVTGLGDAARLTRVEGTYSSEVNGGDAVWAGGSRCSAAFNVARDGVRYFLTAGHCTNISANWQASQGGHNIGVRTGTSFPNNDYGIVRYTDNSQAPGRVNLYNGSFQDIARAADPVVGQSIRKSGSTTGVTSGTVQATNVTVNYGNGNIVYGMVRTNLCSAGGDSGGAHFSGNVALGIHSGGTGSCVNGVGGAVFQPVTEALAAYGVNVY